MEITIPLKTKGNLNGVPVEFMTDAVIDIPAESIDQAAELFAGGHLDIDLSHTDGGNNVYYISGKRYEREIVPEKAEKVEKKAPPVKKPVEAPKKKPETKETKKTTKAKPKG